jgi:hypothetical protein
MTKVIYTKAFKSVLTKLAMTEELKTTSISLIKLDTLYPNLETSDKLVVDDMLTKKNNIKNYSGIIAKSLKNIPLISILRNASYKLKSGNFVKFTIKSRKSTISLKEIKDLRDLALSDSEEDLNEKLGIAKYNESNIDNIDDTGDLASLEMAGDNKTRTIKFKSWQFHLGNKVDYKKIRFNFVSLLSRVFKKLSIFDIKELAHRMAFYYNHNATSHRKYLFYLNKNSSGLNIDTLNNLLGIKHHKDRSGKSTNADYLTVNRIARAFADETKLLYDNLSNNLLIDPSLLEPAIPNLGSMGFINSFMVTGLKLKQLVIIYYNIQLWELSWEKNKTNRFSNTVAYFIKDKFNVNVLNFTSDGSIKEVPPKA